MWRTEARKMGGDSKGCQADAFVALPQWQQAGVGGERRVGHLDPNGQRLVEIEVEEGNSRRYILGSLPGNESGLVVQPFRRWQMLSPSKRGECSGPNVESPP